MRYILCSKPFAYYMQELQPLTSGQFSPDYSVTIFFFFTKTIKKKQLKVFLPPSLLYLDLLTFTFSRVKVALIFFCLFVIFGKISVQPESNNVRTDEFEDHNDDVSTTLSFSFSLLLSLAQVLPLQMNYPSGLLAGEL